MPATGEDGAASVSAQVSYAEELIWRAEHGAAPLPFLECPRHLALAARISGRLDVEAIGRSLVDIIRRHEVLRSRFVERNGHLTRVVATAFDSPLIYPERPDADQGTGDWRAPHDGVGDREAAVQRRLRQEINAPFDLRAGGLVRARLFTLGADQHVLVVTMHHIVADGWSLRLFARELDAFYLGHANGHPTSLPPLQARYQDYVAWQQQRLRAGNTTQLTSAWSEQFGAAPEVSIPGDIAGGDRASTRAAQYAFEIAAEHVERLRQLVVPHRTTIGVGALALFARLVATVTSRCDLMLGIPIWDRSRPSFEDLIGLFMNAVPVRVTVPDEATVDSLLAQTRDQLGQASRFRSLPYAWLREQHAIRSGRAPSPFHIVFNFAAIEGVAISLPGVTTTRLDAFGETPAAADISLHIFDRGERFAGLFIYKADVYSPDRIAWLAGEYVQLMSTCSSIR